MVGRLDPEAPCARHEPVRRADADWDALDPAGRGSTRATAVAERPKPTQTAPPAARNPAGRGPIRVLRRIFSERGSTSTSLPTSHAVTQTRP